MKFFYIPVHCIAFFTLSYVRKARKEIICKESSTSSSYFDLTSFFEFSELYHNGTDQKELLTTVTYSNFFVTDPHELARTFIALK
ncbi:MAG TPA: hypothetical protein VIL78_01950 [Hanamia sp.]